MGTVHVRSKCCTSQISVERPQISDASKCGHETLFIGVTEKCKLTEYEIIGVRACSDVMGYVKYYEGVNGRECSTHGGS